MKENIIAPTGKVVGIGKIKVFATKEFEKEIPTLSFIVAENEGLFTATCINLCLDTVAESVEDACRELVAHCEHYLASLFQYTPDTAWGQLHELFTSDTAIEFEKPYKDAQLNLAEKGIEVQSGAEQYYRKKLEEAKVELRKYKKSESEFSADIVDYNKVAA